MLALGVQIIPHLAAREIARVAVEAEQLGYADFWVSDEGFMVDPFTVLGMIADKTSRIRLGVVTNPYTRHPAMTAAALATLDQMSGGRAELCYVAGGSLVLDPLGLARTQPVQTVQEALLLTRHLLSGDKVTWSGTQFQLKDAQLEPRVPNMPPIHVAARGTRMLEMAARHADAIWTGVDAQTIQTLRAAAGERSLQIICSDHPPSSSDAADALAKAVQQDGGDGETQAPQEDLPAWAARIRQHATLMDSLLVVTWEQDVEQMLTMLHSVKEAFA
jgi:alkanesulfonate monooxygenase SsuD/methylene tetrahydromethanopterin reductase-like flavin-dependent oxidoreductase (luciferase family)